MTIAYTVADRVFENARHFAVFHHEVPAFRPVDEFLQLSISMVRQLKVEVLEGITREARLRLWRLRNTIIYGLLPFSDCSLNIEEQLNCCMSGISSVTALKGEATKLAEAVRFLVQQPYNPKRNLLLTLLRESTGISKS